MANTDVSTAAAKKAKREQVTDREYIGDDNQPVKDPREATGFYIKHLRTGTEIVRQVEQFSPGVIRAAALFGLVTVATNAMGGLSADDAEDALLARIETLDNGEWTSRTGATGPRISMLADALVAAKAADGEEISVADATAYLKSLSDAERKDLSEVAEVKAEYSALRAKAAAERAERDRQAVTKDSGKPSGLGNIKIPSAA